MKIKKLIAFGNTELTNAAQDLYTLLAKNNKFKYAAASQKLTLNSLPLFYMFYVIVFFLIISFQTLVRKKHHVYALSFCYVMHYIVPEIGIGGVF